MRSALRGYEWVAHARFAPVGVAGFFGENRQYRSRNP